MSEHGWFDKQFMYEESLLTPLLMRFPNKIKKGVVEKTVQNIDYSPTFLDFAGVPIPKEIQGKSLKPLLEGKNVPWCDAIYETYCVYLIKISQLIKNVIYKVLILFR